MLFVPVTTRTKDQYQRLSLFNAMIQPQYAITTNGGNIFFRGKLEQGWNQSVRARVKHECLALEDVLGKFAEIKHAAGFLSEKIEDELFYSCVFEREHLPQDEIQDFSHWIETKGWVLSVQGRKIYLVPKAVNKRAALSYIRQRQGDATILIAAGDSLLDLGMLQRADYAIAPAHGEIYRAVASKTLPRQEIHFTRKSGLLCSEEILAFVEKCWQRESGGW